MEKHSSDRRGIEIDAVTGRQLKFSLPLQTPRRVSEQNHFLAAAEERPRLWAGI